MLILLNKPPKIFFKGCVRFYIKNLIRKPLNIKRGPDTVMESLMRGLKEINLSFGVNTMPKDGDIVHVLSNVEALRFAINQKEKGLKIKIVAGPNLIVLPYEENLILENANIDSILLPSPWTVEFYKRFIHKNSQKIHTFPSGVSIPKLQKMESGKDCILLKKQVPESMFSKVIGILKKKNIKFEALEYGKFNQKEYFSKLESAKFLIYLQQVESQGLAIQEAWARDVPTLVWNKGEFTYPTGEKVTGNISAPYLTEKSGMFFSGENDFEEKLKIFVEKLPNFEPRKYCVENLSDRASAEKYASILTSIKP